MTKKLYDLAVATREYEDVHGNKKAVWQNVGAQFENDSGQPYILFEPWFNPAGIERKNGSSRLLINMFAPKNKSSNNAAEFQDNSASQEYNPDIPF